MNPIANSITTGAHRMLALGDALLSGVEAPRFARYAAPGGEIVHANHGAFIYGHLSLYPARLLEAAGEDPAPAAVPAAYTELFQHGAECRDDPDGAVYPPMDELVGAFRDSHAAVLERLAAWPDAKMTEPHAIEGRMAEAFPTLGEISSFLMLGHTMMHLGQMSTWRRAIGLGSAM